MRSILAVAEAHKKCSVSEVTLVVPRNGALSTESSTVAICPAEAMRAVGAQAKKAGGSLGTSWKVWQSIVKAEAGDSSVDLAALGNQLPIAGRAAPDRAGTSVLTAAAAIGEFVRNVRVGPRLEHAGAEFSPRPYQQHGIAWLSNLGAGGILADEMGLGKTLQAIGHLLLRSEAGHGPHLIVCPSALITNWRSELDRFAPGLATHTYRGPDRALPGSAGANTLVIAGYPSLRTDAVELNRLDWDSVFFDEAHVLKNTRTKLAASARQLTAGRKYAMTGTPIENHLSELWSLVDLTQPGAIGDRRRFSQRFVVPIEKRQSQPAFERLQQQIEPLLLRRTKAQVAGELPAKQENNVICELTAEQAGLYRQAVASAFGEGLGSGIGRQGRILALLTELKTICNHPALVTRDTLPLDGRSGKLDRLSEITGELLDSGERALIFTQYRSTGELLARHLKAEHSVRAPFYHGGLSSDNRDKIVADFQKPNGPAILILSLRAAGYGLNLTEASQVVHFDRWWNPAVESQATDRAHRIGQLKPVTVTTLTSEGTIEEHIARIHIRKKATAEVTETDASQALTKLSDEALLDTLSLGW
ncbi:MAG: DEAD/DEAH box helicase [Solirubrobacterales bacterium]